MAPEELLTLPRTRHEAISVGSNKYFTGEVCRKGHISGRYTSTSGCVKCTSIYSISRDREKERARNAKRRLENPEKEKTSQARYRLDNYEKEKTRNAKRRLENPEKERASQAKYYLENSEKIKAVKAKYRLENSEKAAQKIRDSVDLIKPSYIADLLKVSTKQLTPEIIELKRLQIQLFRAIKSIKESK